MISSNHVSTLLVEAWELNTWEGTTLCYSLSYPVYSAATLSMLGQL